MIDTLKDRCDLLVRNRAAILKKFTFQESLLGIASGLIFVMAEQEADVEKMAECRKLLKKSTRPLSNLRAKSELVMLSKMSLAAEPEKYLDDVLDVYKKVCRGILLENAYMALAAMLIVDLGRQDDAESIVAKAGELTKRLERVHPILTSDEDTSYVMLLALTDRSVDDIVSDIDSGYGYLKKTKKLGADKNALFELCEVLAVSYGDMEGKCDKAVRIVRALKARGADFGGGQEFSSLGALVDLDMDADAVAEEILDAEAYLRAEKGWGDSSVDRKKRMMYASLLLADVCGRDPASVADPVISNPVLSNTITLYKAKQMSLLMSIGGSLLQAAFSIAGALCESESDEKSDADTAGSDTTTIP
ncbi:MAG: DUF4003 family protein [Clostridiales bacterium]|nr:DUF4003 family protein [Clostridiales bacterium]